jgi:hypothetical protein
MKNHTPLVADPESRPSAPIRFAVYLSLIVAVVIGVSSKGMLSEGTGVMGDMPVYAMNGVFFYDALRDLPRDPLGYAYRYYARYPALSLGHHPLILPLAEVPAYAILGISIFSSRLVILCFTLFAGILWFLVVRSLYDDQVAFFSSLLFLSSPIIVYFSRVTMSEMSALAFLILTIYYYHEFLRTGGKRAAIMCALSLTLGIYAKLLLVFLIPLLAISMLLEKGTEILRKKTVWVAVALVILLSLPLIILTVNMAKGNLIWIFEHPQQHWNLKSLWAYPERIWRQQLSFPVVILSFLGLALTLVHRRRHEHLFLMWILLLYLELIFIGPNEGRYAIYWVPPFCLFAALVSRFIRIKALKVAFFLLLTGISVYQIYFAVRMEPRYAEGYEQAARFVVENQASTVLYSSNVDDGYFVFFTRKYDRQKKMIVLRADKILATSNLGAIVNELISDPRQIYSTMNSFGIRYLVVENSKSRSRVLEWVEEEAGSEHFLLRKVIPVRSNYPPELRDVNLLIYEYKDWRPADPKAIIRMNIPLMGKDIVVPLADLTTIM